MKMFSGTSKVTVKVSYFTYHAAGSFPAAVWSSEEARMVDAMASGGDEGRANLRKGGMSR